MNSSKRLMGSLMLLGALAMSAITLGLPAAEAATPNYQVGKTEIIALPVSGQYTTSTANVIRFALPYQAKLIGATASARASGGTSPTLTVDVKNGGTSVLNAPFTVTAGTVGEGVITSSNLADEAIITVDLAIGGTSPTWNDITILLTVVRR